MRTLNKIAALCLTASLFCATALLPRVSLGEDTFSVDRHQPKKASEIYRDHADLRDYEELNWSQIPPVDSQTFLPAMRCDLVKKYDELAKRDGFKVSTPANIEHVDPLLGDLDNYEPNGVMPWPGILGYWQDWNDGVYIQVERVKETDPLDSKVSDYMVVKLYSMCSDELLSESSTLVTNRYLNQSLKAPTQTFDLKVNVPLIQLKVDSYSGSPSTDEIGIELHYLDSLNKDAKRNVMKFYRFL